MGAEGPAVARRTLLVAATAGGIALGTASAARAADAPWSPLSIPGCDAWFDASAVGSATQVFPLQTGGPVSGLASLVPGSVRALATEVTASYQPLLEPAGLSDRVALRFSGAQGLTSSLDGRPSAMTVIAVIEQDEIRAGSFLGTGTTGFGDGFEFRVNADGTVTGARSGVWEIGTSTKRIVAGRPNLVAFLYDDTGSWACVVNGEVSGFGYGGGWAYGETRPSTFALGYSSPAGVGRFTGRIGEVARWRRALRGDELRDAIRRLGAKWRVRLTAPVSARTPAPLTVPTGLKGSNISPKLDMYSRQDRTVWTTFWRDWDWAWVQHCIDTAQGYGSTAVRIIGGVEAVLSGSITQSVYDARQLQVAAELGRRGMHYYPCGFDLHASTTTDPAKIAASLSATAAALAAHRPTVIGFDLVNELATNYTSYGREPALALVERLATAVRQAAPKLPLTVSDIGDLNWGALSRGTPLSVYRRLSAHLDFFDVHVYAGTGLRPWHLLPYELSVDRPIVLGEFGEDLGANGDGVGAAYYRSVRDLRAATRSLAAVFQWAVIEDTCGLESETGSVHRAATAAEWRRF